MRFNNTRMVAVLLSRPCLTACTGSLGRTCGMNEDRYNIVLLTTCKVTILSAVTDSRYIKYLAAYVDLIPDIIQQPI